jgi:hypothetical protein
MKPLLLAASLLLAVAPAHSQTTTSAEHKAILLLQQKSPSVKRVISSGQRVGFMVTEDNIRNDCVIEIRAYEDHPTHIATIGFFRVDICNNLVYGVDRY